ncbi:MAG TPA: sugar phosphate isomerase/epimerase, partial [Blastocatellia bacterium]|nr:sugar phosphate isomerase/epimerase [Blastocatellia bacterium]
MKLALNGATTMKADLETDILAARSAGFDCLEIWAAKLRKYLATHSTTDLRTILAAQRIEPYSINSIERINFRPVEERPALFEECEELCRIASEISCPYIVVVPGPAPEAADQSYIIEETVRALGELGRIAERFSVKLAFEFLGQTGCSVQTLDLAREIVEKLDVPNIGLVVDSFHFYAGGSTIESLEALDGDRLFIFHINDAEDLPRERLEDRHRLLPGLG